MFSYWTDPFANERLIGTDRAQDHERVINRENGGEEEEERETRESSLETQVKREWRLEMEMHRQTGE